MKKIATLLVVLIVTALMFSCGSGSGNTPESIPLKLPEDAVGQAAQGPPTAPPSPETPETEATPDETPVENAPVAEQTPGPRPGEISLGFAWTAPDGTHGETELYTGDESDLQGKGIWVTYSEAEGQLKPTLIVGEDVFLAEPDANHLQSLDLVVTCNDSAGPARFERTLFRKDLVLGMDGPRTANTYAVFINKVLIETGQGQDVARADVPDPAALTRTRGLALAYAAQSDAYARYAMSSFGVQAEFAVPRIVVAAEEWMEIEAEKAAPTGGGGGILGFDLESAMEGGQDGAAMKSFSTYSIDVLRDDMETTGGDEVAFQTARSLRNDILEGEVIYAATGGQRRVLTASIVFSQLMQNRSTLGTDNQVLTVTSERPEILDQCTDLFPEAKARIVGFLAKSPDWIVRIPQKPVIFLRDNTPAYGTYAWFMVHPQTGRMVGMLPNGLHGASDEVNALHEALRQEAVERATELARERMQQMTGNESGVHTFFGAVAGMYVASAGVLDGIGITMEDPSIAALSPEEWLQFIADHALQHCREFLEQHSDDYGYSARVGYWGGAMSILGNLGGADTVNDVATAAWNDIKDKAVDDIRQAIEDRAGDLAGAGREAVEDAVFGAAADYAQRARDFQRYAGTAESMYGFQSGVAGADFTEEIAPQLNGIVENVLAV